MACCTAPYYADCFVVMLIILALGEAISLPSRPSSLSIDLQKLFYTFWKKKLSFGPLLTRGLHRFKLQKSLLISLVSKRTWRQSDLSTKALERTREPPHCISFGSVSASSSSSSSSGSSASTDSASAASVSTSLAFFFFFFPESGVRSQSKSWVMPELRKKQKLHFEFDVNLVNSRALFFFGGSSGSASFWTSSVGASSCTLFFPCNCQGLAHSWLVKRTASTHWECKTPRCRADLQICLLLPFLCCLHWLFLHWFWLRWLVVLQAHKSLMHYCSWSGALYWKDLKNPALPSSMMASPDRFWDLKLS